MIVLNRDRSREEKVYKSWLGIPIAIQLQRMQVLPASSLLNTLTILQTMVAQNEESMIKFLEQSSALMEHLNLINENLRYVGAEQVNQDGNLNELHHILMWSVS